MQIEKEQIRQIHTILARMARANDKAFKLELIQEYTNKRETSTTGLTYDEAAALITDLNRVAHSSAPLTMTNLQANAKRRRILSYAHMMGWEAKDGETEWGAEGKPKVDMARVNGWCVEYGYLHKPLNDYSLQELSKLVWQMEMVYKSFLNAI